jgi:hypothetical protein
VRLAVAMVSLLALAACQPQVSESEKDHININIAVDTGGLTTATRNGKPMTDAELQALLDLSILRSEDAEKLRITQGGKTMTLDEYLTYLSELGKRGRPQ